MSACTLCVCVWGGGGARARDFMRTSVSVRVPVSTESWSSIRAKANNENYNDTADSWTLRGGPSVAPLHFRADGKETLLCAIATRQTHLK